MRVPISIKLIIYFLLISISSIFIVGKFSFYKAKEALIERTFDQLISLRVEKEKRLQSFFDQCSNDITNITSLNDVKIILNNIKKCDIDSFGSSKIMSKYILGYLQANNKFNKIIFIDTSSAFFGYDVKNSDNQCFDTLLYFDFNEEIIVSEDVKIIESVASTGEFFINIGKVIKNDDSVLLGVVILEISYDPIDDIMFEDNIHNGLGKSGEVYLVGTDFLMRSSSRFISNSKFITLVKTIGVKNSINNNPGKNIIDDYRGIKVFSSYKKLEIGGLDWIILSEIDEYEAMQLIKSVENNIIYLSIIISLLLMGIVAAISSNITSPIRKLQAETEKIYRGEYGQIINLEYNNEIGDLINAFNRMSVQLKEQAERLEYEQVIRTTYVIDGQEAERQRLSRELHDGLAQYILAIKLKLEHALSVGGEKQKMLIEQTKDLFTETIKEIRNISNNLMPSVLSKYGIIKAVENLSASVNSDSKLNFTFESDFLNNFLNQKMQIYIYRIIQEALNNTLKHAQANNFYVSFVEKENELFILIKDDGKGFDVSQKSVKSGNGLVNIRERVNLLSGKILIETALNEGFCLKISIPV
ncbi:MAG: HAMP domain-containing protein [Bacteroidales bacterium]|nr:HAMP domain-containing protein [Bacteroidales bacterium]